ncbi:MAG: amino acid adenylation domain-containing protein, partial [Longimicrobiaceae bacterium]
GESPRLAQGRRFREYVAWLERQELAGAERFWRRALAGFAAPTPLPGERRAAVAEQGHGETHLLLGEEGTRALQSRARGWGVTMSTLVQGAWALLLGRHAGEDDVVFGATVAGRPAELAGAEETVGMFINTLPVRVRLDAAAGVREWLQGLQKEQVEAREHEHAPLADVQRWSEVPAGQPLFETLVVFENYPVDEAVGEAGANGLGGLRVRPSGGREQASYPLGLQAQATARLRMEIRYDRGRVEAEAVERVASQLEGVLEAMAAPGERRLSELPLLRGAERARVLEAWNATASDPPRACLHELFAEQAARTPDAVAVVFRDESLTYAALERRSGRLAHLLRGRGVGPETCVGLCVERGLAMVVGLLGILRAGGVYVPLDPAYPAERLAYMLADSGASVLLAEPALRDVLPSFTGSRVCLDLRAEPDPPAQAPVESGVGPDNAAYVIYTSGSTGLPKGVVVTHGNAANLLPRAVEAFGAGPGSRVLQTASPSFDASLLEIFVALLSGGALHVAEREVVLSAERLGALLREREIGVWVSTPALLEILGETELPALHTVSTGGERCPAETAARWSVGRRLVNMYGPTETTIYTTAHACAPGVAQAPPIGRPVANTRAYVVDGWGEPAPVGMPGELWVGGAGVSRGYLGRPELTAERFVPDAFGGAPGGRLYRTGDRVRWLAGGELEYLGRTDSQVKIRGFRIEPGEIEAALLGVEGVREALVLAREDVPGQKRLVGYVAARAEVELSAADLRAHLAGRLPEHMVPGALVVLERLPLTAGGKVDRRALPAPERGSAAGGRAEPRTEAERILCEVWAGVLKLDHVGVEENFFELGGDSILSIQVVSRARARGLRLTPRQIFEHPTVAALAGVAERVDAEADAAAQGPVTGEAPLTPVQRRFFTAEHPARHHYNMGLLLRPAEALDAGLLARAAAAVEAHHDALRLRFRQEAQGGWTASHAGPGARGPLVAIDLSGLPAGARKGALETAAEQVQR